LNGVGHSPADISDAEPEVSGADDRYASAMEGTSCANDMRLLHERIEYRFSFSFSSDFVFGGRKSDYTIGYGIQKP